jgi:hypothetical protein
VGDGRRAEHRRHVLGDVEVVAGSTGRDTVDAGAGRDTSVPEGTSLTESPARSCGQEYPVVDHDARRRIGADGVEDVTYIGFGGLDDGGSGDAVAVNDMSGTGVLPDSQPTSTPAAGQYEIH